MRRARPQAQLFRACLAVSLLAAAGCGQRDREQTGELTFEQPRDTTGLSQGPAVLEGIEPYREGNGLLRVKGRLRLPDGTRIQISLLRAGDSQVVTRVQTSVQNGRFDSPPMMGEKGPFPAGRWRFEVLAYFNTTWQPPEVLDAIGSRDLRGPGITLTRHGELAFQRYEERTL